MERPKFTVITNIVSPESVEYIGRCWEFFSKEEDAIKCFKRQLGSGNSPSKRSYYHLTDYEHMAMSTKSAIKHAGNH